MSRKNGLAATLETIEQETSGERIVVGDIVAALEKRGFGPLLIAPALITALPTGAIPFVPAICAILIILFAGQMVLGAGNPWLPKKIKSYSLSRTKFQRLVKKSKPLIRWVDNCAQQRFEILTHKIAQRLIAALCIFLAGLIILIGFIPFAPTLPALAILLFGLGISMRDGLIILLGFAVVFCALLILPSMIGWS